MVCKSCGSEVSPYITECPYCGHRLRKRAPDLKRDGDEITVQEGRRERRKRLKRERDERKRSEAPARGSGGGFRDRFDADGLPTATIAVLFVSAVVMVVERAVPWSIDEVGAIVGPVGSEWWRYVAAPFVYQDMGVLVVTAAALSLIHI